MTLHISDTLELPDSMVTETIAILAKRGVGKSNAGVVLAEEMHDGGHQWVAIDPKGDWWGIRSDHDGTGPGLQVPIFGGSHGDVPLEATAGAVMARLIVEQHLSCVLDVSEFSKGDQIRFVTDFAEQLFRSVKADPRPLHLILEEAEEFLPQRVDAKSARMVGAYSKISKQGRQIGLGVTLITQRSASLNKDALSQTDTLVLFRTTSPHDRKAVVAWADHQGEAGQIAESLSSLEPGESWVISPGVLSGVHRIRWRRRRTYDSGATPVTGAKTRRAPVDLASIDLDAIAEQLADTIERAEADDPKRLRARIVELERQVTREQQMAVAVAAQPVEIEVPTIDIDSLNAYLAQVQVVGDTLRAALEANDELRRLIGRMVRDSAAQHLGRLVDYGHTEGLGNGRPLPAPRPSPAAVDRRRTGVTPGESHPGDVTPAGDIQLGKAERAVLSVLAQHPAGRTKVQVALLTGYSAKGGGFNNALGKLRTAGLIEGTTDLTATPAGLDAVAGQVQPLPTGQALIDHWANQLGKAEGLILRHLVDIWPATNTKAEVAEATGYAATGGGFNNALGRLRTLQLIHGTAEIAAADELGGAR